MKELLNSVSNLADQELIQANKKFSKFNSPHEAYGVLREEIEEHEEDTKKIIGFLNAYWCTVRANNFAQMPAYLIQLKQSAIHAAAEATQIAAMAQKTLDMLSGDGS